MQGSNSTQIVNSPTNNSTSKFQFSFPKAKRFQEITSATGKFYNIPNTFSKRSTSFGYGKKYDFTTEKEKTPDPGAYQQHTDDKAKLKGYTFGLSRDSCKSYVEGHFAADPAIPGPGAYSFTPKFSNEGRKITLSGKHPEPKVADSVPGPGAYDQSWSHASGKYVVSSAKNLQVHSFSPKSSTRFPKEDKKVVPAPGAYDVDKGFLNYGKVLSTCKSSGAISFGLTSRINNSEVKNTPGPGAYRMPSEFGYYDSPKDKSQSVSTNRGNTKRSEKTES